MSMYIIGDSVSISSEKSPDGETANDIASAGRGDSIVSLVGVRLKPDLRVVTPDLRVCSGGMQRPFSSKTKSLAYSLKVSSETSKTWETCNVTQVSATFSVGNAVGNGPNIIEK